MDNWLGWGAMFRVSIQLPTMYIMVSNRYPSIARVVPRDTGAVFFGSLLLLWWISYGGRTGVKFPADGGYVLDLPAARSVPHSAREGKGKRGNRRRIDPCTGHCPTESVHKFFCMVMSTIGGVFQASVSDAGSPLQVESLNEIKKG